MQQHTQQQVEYGTLNVGDEAVLDGETRVVVTKTSVYVNSSQHNREAGYSVRPVAGGRARPVSASRLSYAPTNEVRVRLVFELSYHNGDESEAMDGWHGELDLAKVKDAQLVADALNVVWDAEPVEAYVVRP